MATIAERLAEFQTKRQQLADQKQALVEKAVVTEGRTFDQHESEQNAELEAQIKSIDETITQLKAHETIMVAKAAAVAPNAGQGQGAVHIPGSVISVHRNLPKGAAFTRFAMAMAVAKGSRLEAAHIAEHTWKDTPEVAQVLKAAVAAGSTSNSTWAGPLVQYNDMTGEFIELLRPMTILGKLELVRIAFNSRIPRQTSGTAGTFVGESAPTPVRAMAFDNVVVPWAKASTITVFSVELQRLSDPSIEAIARRDLLNGMSQYLDKRFVDPAYAGVSGVSPASVTNGVTPRQASGSSLAAIDADVRYLQTQFANAELSLQRGVWIMSASQAIRLSMIRTNQDTLAFPGLTVNGGTFYGMPVIVSNNVVGSGSPGDQYMLLLSQDEVFLADDGQADIDVNPYASVEMSDTPSGGSTSLHSLWQNGEVGVKLDRWIYWAKRRAEAVQFIDKAQSYAS